MKYWEFLIQKEGDQTWLPLETQQVEILEGRYRVVAHTDRANTSMNVRVSQLVMDEMPPRRRVRKRVGTTNDSGLVLVMPFVNLKPGQWDVKCSSLEGAEGEPWQYSVQLQVFAHTEEDWSGEWPVPNDHETASSLIVEGEGEVSPELINQDLPLIQAQAELEANSLDTPKKLVEAPSYQVALKQQAYLAHPQLPMKIVGKVSALSGTIAQESSQLWIRLQNPETAKVIMEASRPLSLARLPADFKVQIQLPTEVSARVILGEVSLRSEAAGSASDGGEVLAATSFTISAGIAELLEAIANQDNSAFLGVFEEEIISMPTLDLVQNPISPAIGVVLPPKLEQIDYLAFNGADPTGAESNHSLDINSRNGHADRNGHAQPDLPSFADESNLSDLDHLNPNHSNPNHSNPNHSNPNHSNLIVSDAPHQSPPNHSSDISDISEDIEEQPPQEPRLPHDFPREPIIERVPMVAQPAQFLGTSVEDSDIEADEIAAVLEDIDKNLSAEESDLDALEAPGVEAALPNLPRSHTARSNASRSNGTKPLERSQLPTDEQAVNLAANETARNSDQRSQKSPYEISASLDFQSLRLKDHFWNRLSNLTHKSHQEATQLAEQMKAAGVDRGQSDLTSNPLNRRSSEVVIYSDPQTPQPNEATTAETNRLNKPLPPSTASTLAGQSPATPNVSANSPLVERLLNSRSTSRHSTNRHSTSRHSTSRRGTNSQSINDLSTTEMHPSAPQRKPGIAGAQFTPPSAESPAIDLDSLPEMALPVISVPMGDLVAGEIITVTVRTRPSVYKPFIKLWMVDRQSRSLVIEPKLLTNMIPDALGDLETSTQLQIPMHCLDVQIAAIAVDMATQQESAKAIVNRHVVPADQSMPFKDAGI